MKRRRIEELLTDEEESLRRTVRRSLKSLSVPTLKVLLRAIRYAEEGITPMVIAAEDLSVPYRAKVISKVAQEIRKRNASQPQWEEDQGHED